MKRLLVIGGTRFVGRHVVDTALAHGMDVTTFTRGVSGEPPAGVRALHGDRSRPDDLAVLATGEWDLVVDTSGYVPRQVGDSAAILADRVGHYVFVSTLNTYPGLGTEPIHDASPTHDCPPDEDWHGTDEEFVHAYGRLKVGCERAVERHFAGRCTHVRAGVIIGPYDNAARVPWQVWRIGRVGGELIGPGDPAQEMSFVDARDLAEWFLHCGRDGVSGAYAATGPKGQTTIGEVFATIRALSGSDAEFTWIPDDFLLAHDVGPWEELPLWSPVSESPYWDVDPSGAMRNGLVCRPIGDTLADTWAWVSGLDALPVRADRPRTGLAPDKERRILDAWHASLGHARGAQ